MLFAWTIGLLLLATVRGAEVCYSHLGCFSDEKPWAGTSQRPIKSLPSDPKKINTRFLLYTNENQNSYQLITATDIATIKASNFNLNRKTRFIIHGFTDSGENSWLSDMCKNMFQVEKVNCICVDWKGGSKAQYSQASQNIRVVGAEVAYLVQVLSTSLNYAPENVHIIGHSLGAHTAGEAGKRLNGLVGRITGLDPAEPYFQDTPEEVRLDPSDAKFVDVIHTDISPILPSLGFGMSQKVGHMDFFPNGGKDMPGCKTGISCNHHRSIEYYHSSILNPEGFLGYPCASYDEFQESGCFPCPAKGCPKMGHFADQYPGKTNAVEQTFFLNTGASDNFTRWRYKVTVTLSGEKDPSGNINVALLGKNGNSAQYQVFKGTLKPDASYTNSIDVELNVGTIQKVTFLWKRSWISVSKPKMGASRITVQSGKDGTKYNFCSSDIVQENVEQTLSPC
uniref:Triacylglycerol lipase n=1 Tax=Cavia porcellus TaxID=10141 RepID=H0V008_CAVPO